MMYARAPTIITLFARYFRRAPPTKTLDTKAATAKIPISIPISLSVEPNLERYRGRVGVRA